MVKLADRACQPESIIDKLDKITSYDSAGQFQIDFGYPDYSYYDLLLVFASMLRLSSDVPDAEKVTIVSEAVKSAKQKGKITRENLFQALSILENIYLGNSKSNYVLATYISADSWFTEVKLPSRQINGATITFSRDLPPSFLSEYREIWESAQRIILRKFPERYQAVRVRVSAYNVAHAAEIALNSLDILRGIWNLAVNRSTSLHSRSSGGIRRPINVLVLGPLHTLHKPSGERATDISRWWYEPSYITPLQPFRVSQHSDKMYKGCKNN